MIFKATYGKKDTQTKANIICVYDSETELYYYVVYNSKNINITNETLYDGINIEQINDIDSMISNEPIINEQQLKQEIYE